MPLASVWRRLTFRKHRRKSFYETQDVMRRAVEAEAAGKKPVSPLPMPPLKGPKVPGA